MNKSQGVSFDHDLRISQPKTLLDGLSLRENKSGFNARVRGAGSIPKFSGNGTKSRREHAKNCHETSDYKSVTETFKKE